MKVSINNETKIICDICFQDTNDSEDNLEHKDNREYKYKVNHVAIMLSLDKFHVCNYCRSDLTLSKLDRKVKKHMDNPVKRLKWWMVLFEYEEKGYKVERR